MPGGREEETGETEVGAWAARCGGMRESGRERRRHESLERMEAVAEALARRGWR